MTGLISKVDFSRLKAESAAAALQHVPSEQVDDYLAYYKKVTGYDLKKNLSQFPINERVPTFTNAWPASDEGGGDVGISLRAFGTLLCGIGFVGSVAILLFFDVDVAVSGVANLDAMNIRLLLYISATAVWVAGAVMLALDMMCRRLEHALR